MPESEGAAELSLRLADRDPIKAATRLAIIVSYAAEDLFLRRGFFLGDLGTHPSKPLSFLFCLCAVRGLSATQRRPVNSRISFSIAPRFRTHGIRRLYSLIKSFLGLFSMAKD